MLRIGEFAKCSGLTIDTLYHYENQKLLKPDYIDTNNGYRYYQAEQLVTVNKILALKDAGLSLEEISSVFHENLSVTSLIELLENKSLLLEEELKEEMSRLERLRTNIFLIKNGGIPQMNEITIKRVEPILAVTCRKSFESSQFDEVLTELWSNVNDYIDLKGGKRTVPCMMLYHTGWESLDDRKLLDVEVVEPITRSFPGNERISVTELPAVEKMVCGVHTGPFSTIGTANKALFDWIEQNGYKKSGPMREIYHKGEWMTDNPEEYITELQIPIE